MKTLIDLIKEHVEYGDFILKSGKKTNFYLDIKKLSLSGHLISIISELNDIIKDLDFNTIGGPCIGSDEKII